jgi:hypothetical protein
MRQGREVDRREIVIKSALNIIAPKTDRRNACRAAIAEAIDELGVEKANTHWASYPNTKQSKRSAARLGFALRKVRHTFAATERNLDLSLRLYFPLKEIEKWIHHCEKLEDKRAPRKARSEPDKTRAAERAYLLMRDWSRHQIVTTKKSPFCRLAALLTDEPDVDRTYICRKVLRKVRLSAEPSAR